MNPLIKIADESSFNALLIALTDYLEKYVENPSQGNLQKVIGVCDLLSMKNTIEKAGGLNNYVKLFEAAHKSLVRESLPKN